MITAKVAVHRKTESGVGNQRQVTAEFIADYADGRNKGWSLNTPCLALSMQMKGEVADLFPIGQPFTLTFEQEPATTE